MILIDTLHLNKTSRRPVWIMRQAGRYLSSFREMRKKYRFDEMALNPELAAEATLLPLEKYKLDAAIVFSDILYPLRAMGAKLEFTDRGPKIEQPQTEAELSKLRTSFFPENETPAILETIKLVRKAVGKDKAVLGFAGAPFTLLSYLLEGDLSRELKTMKRWMAERPTVVHQWLDHLATAMGIYLDAQAKAGANAVQLFDTWAGVLSPEDYESFALPYARKALSAVTVPSLYYVNGMSGFLEIAASVGAQALSVDWRISLREARQRVSRVTALQGNLDPYHLLLPAAEIRERVFRMCESYGTSEGHIVNLGHGIVPEIPEDSVKAFIDAVHEWSAAKL